jgi:formylglycine-generating enzyme required for sulfatase activity
MARWTMILVTALLLFAHAHPAAARAPYPAAWHVPQTVTIPPGRFVMGTLASEGGDESERPPHEVRIGHAFALGTYLVTFAQWDACVDDGGCGGYRPSDLGLADHGVGRGRLPVFDIDWDDAQAYVAWLRRRTGQAWRLPTEAEWEYAARAGTHTAYYWGASVGRNHANCDGCASAFDGNGPSAVGSFAPNRFGLFDMAGNLLEWTSDCWHETYAGAPADGTSWEGPACPGRVARGGSYDSVPDSIRAGVRVALGQRERGNATGFRVARTLSP